MVSNDRFARGSDSLTRLKSAAALWVLVAGLAASPVFAHQADAQQPRAQQAEPEPPASETVSTQDDPDEIPEPVAEEGEVIVVTGFRSSLRASLIEKRNADGVIDVIKAEDIADFPTNNLAESIQRIPGVTITRDAGEGRNISVRGLPPLFTRVRINGIEGLGTTGASDAAGAANQGGGTNRSRQFDFNIFAADLFNSITVRKTPSAEIEEGSLGATVDLQTARPFDYSSDRTIVASAQAGYNDFSKSWDPRFAGLVSAKFADGKVGVLLSAAYSKREILEEGPSTVRWDPATANQATPPPPTGGFNGASTLPTGATDWNFFHPRIPRYDSYEYHTNRLGLTGSIQLEPTDKTLITIDALYAKFKSRRAEQYLEAISFSRGAGGKRDTIILPAAIVDENNSLVFGEFDNVDVRVESRYDELETKFKQVTVAVSHEFSDAFQVNLLGGRSKSDFDNPIQTTVALDVANVDSYSYDFREGRFPVFGYGNLDVADPTRWTLGEIRLRPQAVANDFTVLRGDAAYEVSPAFTLKAGVDYKKYGFDSTELRRASETAVPVLAPGQLAGLTTLYTIETSLPGGTPATFVIPNLDAFARDLDIYCNCGTFEQLASVTALSNWRTVDEKDLGIWAQGDFDFDLGGVRLRGNLGARWVQTKQKSTGYTGLELIKADRKYDHFVPSLNVAADISRDFVLRGAIARVIARPDIGDLSPGGSLSVSGGNRTFTPGNPFIEPTEATTYDLSAEWYFAPESALIVGLFYKDISTFVANTAEQIPFNELGLPVSLLIGTGAVPTDVFTVTRPVNSNGGSLKGIEIGVQMPFRFLPGPLKNFGMLANYTYVDSKIDYPLSAAADAPVIKERLVGLSEHTANGTLYYEDKKFSIRGSISYRSDFLTRVPARNGLSPPNPNAAQPKFNDVEGTNSSVNIDMSASYNINENFALTFEGVNLTDEYVDQYIDSAADRLSVVHHTGRQFYAGARLKF